MIPIAQQKILQIEITNACPHRCSNCTRFCDHHPKPFMMDFETFKRALASVKDYPGMIGIMGGEPTIHPEFDKFVTYFADHFGSKGRSSGGIKPIEDFTQYRNAHLSRIRRKSRGLWTSLGRGYYKHFELIQEVFDYQCINTHDVPSLHQAILVSSKELEDAGKISREERLAKIDNCWVNKDWSASITPKGAFFCEFAGAMDMLFDGPGGWPVEPGWWERPPSDWADQLHWCDLCGAAMDTPSRPSNEELDDVSPGNLKRLMDAGSRRAKRGQVIVHKPEDFDPEDRTLKQSPEWYLQNKDNKNRIGGDRSIYPAKLEGLCVCVGYADFLSWTLPYNVAHFDKFVVVTTVEDTETQEVAEKYGAHVVISDRAHENGEQFNKGKMVNDGMKVLDGDGWILFTDADIILPEQLRANVFSMVLNPGALHYTARLSAPPDARQEWLRQYQADRSLVKSLGGGNPADNLRPWGYFQLFTLRARALRGTGRDVYSEKFPTAGGVDFHFKDKFPGHKQVLMPQDGRFACIHIPHGPLGINWSGRCTDPVVEGYVPTEMPAAGEGWRTVGWVDAEGFHKTDRTPHMGFLRLTRLDTGEAVIAYHNRRKRRNVILGANRYNAYHVGFVGKHYEVALDPENKGRIVVQQSHKKEWSGWGMGHVMFEDDRQGYCWAGEEIDPTRFDLSYKAALDRSDAALLIDGE